MCNIYLRHKFLSNNTILAGIYIRKLNSPFSSFSILPLFRILLFIMFFKTRLVNKTDQLIGFDVERGSCPLLALPAGESQRVSVHVVLNINFNRPTSPIRVLINGRFHGMWLQPYQIAKMTQIVFKYQHGLLIAEGSIESYFDRFFACCIKSILFIEHYT